MSRDWSLSDAEIARQEGVHASTITRQRKAAGVAPTTPHKPVDWAKADWTKTDYRISKEIGCSAGRVSQKRRELGIDPVRKQGVRDCYWKGIDWTKPNKVIAAETGKGLTAVTAARFRYAEGVRAAVRKPGKRQQERIDAAESRAVHECLDRQRVPRESMGKRLSLLERLAIKIPFSLGGSIPLASHVQAVRDGKINTPEELKKTLKSA